MMIYNKLEMVTLQGIVYFEDKGVIIVKEKCHIWHCSFLNSLGDLKDSGYFRKPSVGGWNEMEILLGYSSEIC